MDLWTLVGLALLVAWAVATFASTAPGWVHGLLTVGVFLVIWRMVVRGTPDPDASNEPADPADATPPRRDHAPRG